MKLLRYIPNNGQPEHGVQFEGSIYRLGNLSTTEALEFLIEGSDQWKRILDQPPISIENISYLPPVESPGAFLDFYTFEQHVKTSREKRGLKMVPEWYQLPVWYNGSPRCFSGNETRVDFPLGENKKDFELELAIVIKKKCFRVREKEASKYIGAYTIVNDFSAREL